MSKAAHSYRWRRQRAARVVAYQVESNRSCEVRAEAGADPFVGICDGVIAGVATEPLKPQASFAYVEATDPDLIFAKIVSVIVTSSLANSRWPATKWFLNEDIESHRWREWRIVRDGMTSSERGSPYIIRSLCV